MDKETAKNKRPISDLDEVEDDSLQTQSNRARPSFLNGFEAQSVILSEVLSAKQVTILESFIRSVVQEEVELQVSSYIRSILSSNSQLSNQIGKEATVIGSGTLKFKLFFLNQTAPTIFTNNEIEAKNGTPLLVAICDTTNSNAVIKTGPLSSVLVKLVVLNLEIGSGQRLEETSWTASDFNESVVSKREGKRPLIVGNDMIICLKNGVGFIKGLSFSDNSSWTKSKKFRLGARVIDKNIIAEFPRIGEAVSKPFRVMDQRGEVYKKHHPPSREDEIWRLEGIGKDRVYHNRLSSNGIKTVDDFLKAYDKKGPTYLKRLLGEKVPKNTWKKMVSNALECDALALNPSFGVHLMGNEAMGGETFNKNFEDGEQKNSRENDGRSENIEDDQFDGKLQGLASFIPSSRASLTHKIMVDRCLEVREKNSFNYGHGFPETLFSKPEFDGQLQDLVSYPPSFEQHLAGNYEAIIGGHATEGIREQDYHFIFNDDYPPLLPHGEASTSDTHNNENGITHKQYNQGRSGTGLVPKPT